VSPPPLSIPKSFGNWLTETKMAKPEYEASMTPRQECAAE